MKFNLHNPARCTVVRHYVAFGAQRALACRLHSKRCCTETQTAQNPSRPKPYSPCGSWCLWCRWCGAVYSTDRWSCCCIETQETQNPSRSKPPSPCGSWCLRCRRCGAVHSAALNHKTPADLTPLTMWLMVPTVQVVWCVACCLMVLLSPRSASLATNPPSDDALLVMSTLRAFCR
jgi:hypothetical protein